MLFRNIELSLLEQGFEKLPNNGGSPVTTYVQITSNREVKIVHVFNHMESRATDQNILVGEVKQFEKLYILRGYDVKMTMNVIVVNEEYDVSILEKNDLKYWVVSKLYNRLMIFENQPEEFGGLRKVIENSIEQGDVRPNFSQKAKMFFVKNPWITILIALVNIVVFIIFNGLESGELDSVIYNKYGISYDNVLGKYEYYRLLTGMFLHANYKHIINNLFLLIVAGSQVEGWIGHIRFLLVYLASGIGAGVVSVIYYMHTETPVVSVGASGAIFGIFAATLIMAFFVSKNDLKRLVLIAVLALSASMGEQVDTAAHVGGFVVGLVTTLAFRVRVVFVKHR